VVRIRVEQQPDRLLLNIQDHGQGFDARRTKGLGLLGIQERVTRLGGTCQVHSQPCDGTTLSVQWPFAQAVHRSVLESIRSQPGG
jgi:signal transduction histidine kinase